MRLNIPCHNRKPLCELLVRPSISAEIFSQVERETGITKAQMRGKSRKQGIVWARQQAMFMSDATGRSLPATARMMNCHHTTVLHGIRAHAARIGVESPR